MDMEYRISRTMEMIRPIALNLMRIDIASKGYMKRYEVLIDRKVTKREYRMICRMRTRIVKNKMYANKKSETEILRDLALAVMIMNDNIRGATTTVAHLTYLAGNNKPIPLPTLHEAAPVDNTKPFFDNGGNVSSILQSLKDKNSQSLNKQVPQSLEDDDGQSLEDDDEE